MTGTTPFEISTLRESVPRIVFINRYFYPDRSATSQMLSDLAFFLAGAGLEVCVVTSCQRYDDAAAVLPARERIDGVEVHRVRTTRFGRRSEGEQRRSNAGKSLQQSCLHLFEAVIHCSH